MPSAGNGRAVSMGIPGARKWEQDGDTVHVRSISDEKWRLMVVVNWDTDLGDALEWAEVPITRSSIRASPPSCSSTRSCI